MSDSERVETVRTELSMRWSDLDALGHVNNATYDAYLDDVHEFLRAGGVIDGAASFDATHLEYLHPMGYTTRPIEVISEVARTEVRHTVHDETGRVVARARRYVAGEPVPEVPPEAFSLQLLRRATDGDRAGWRRRAVLDLLQEGRIRFNESLSRARTARRFALAALTVRELAGAAAPHDGPDLAGIRARLWVDHVGDSSFRLGAHLSVGEHPLVLSSAVMVAFDAQTQVKDVLGDAERASLLSFAHETSNARV